MGDVDRERHLESSCRTAGGCAVAVLLTVSLLEGGLRLLENHSSLIHLLVYSSSVPTDYGKIHTVEGLLHSKQLLLLPGGSFAGFRLNSHGFRTPEYTMEKPDDVRRILVLGDSFASDSGGVPLHQMWHMRAGKMLERATSQKIEVINLGVPGVGPLFLERLFAIEGKTLHPDIVVVSFFVGNDLTDEGVSEGGRWERMSYVVRFWSNGIRLFQSDTVMAELLDQWRVFREGGRTGGVQDTEYVYDPRAPTFSEEEYRKIARGRANIFLKNSRENEEKLLAEAMGALERLTEDIERAGAEPAIIIIPDELQVNAALRRAVRETDPPTEENMDLTWIQDAVRTDLEARGEAVLDLLPAFQRESQEKHLYKPRDTHWNESGNLLAAKELAQFIRDHPALRARIQE